MKPLDRTDIGLLQHLQNDARASNKELGGVAGLAPSSVFERVRRLRADGVIRGFHADLDPDAVGIAIQALVTVGQTGLDPETLGTWLLDEPEVVSVFELGGADDVLVHIAVRDAVHLREWVYALQRRTEVHRTQTTIVFRHRSRGVPVYGPESPS